MSNWRVYGLDWAEPDDLDDEYWSLALGNHDINLFKQGDHYQLYIHDDEIRLELDSLENVKKKAIELAKNMAVYKIKIWSELLEQLENE